MRIVIKYTYSEDEKYGLISDPIVIHQEVNGGQNPLFEFNNKMR